YRPTHPATLLVLTLSLHDALPICLPARRALEDGGEGRAIDALPRQERPQREAEQGHRQRREEQRAADTGDRYLGEIGLDEALHRSEEHTSELQSRENLVCRLLLEK